MVWRCLNRLDYGPRYCPDSATIDEETLHAAIAEAIAATYKPRHEAVPFFMAHASRTIQETQEGGIDAAELENRIVELKAATMELVNQSICGNSVGENEGRFKSMSDEIRALTDRLTEYRESHAGSGDAASRAEGMAETLYAEPEESGGYDDDLVRQLIAAVRVMGTDRLLITFKCGLEYEQPMESKVRKNNRTA